jgi:hypothetical protein
MGMRFPAEAQWRRGFFWRSLTRRSQSCYFFAKIARRGACTESPRERLNIRLREYGYGGQAAGAYLVQAPADHCLSTPGEGRAVPAVLYPARGGCVSRPHFRGFPDRRSPEGEGWLR